MDIRYRDLVEADIEQLRRLEAEIWPGYKLPEHRWSIDDMHRCFPIMGAFHKEKLVGALCAMPMESGFFWVHFLFVDKEYRNRQVGTKLLGTLFSKLEKKSKGIMTEIKKGEDKIFGFYKKLGFFEKPGTEYVDFWGECYFVMEKKF